MDKRTRLLLASCLSLYLLPLGHAQAASAKFTPTFLYYYGGGARLTPADVPRLAKYDLLDVDRFRYNDILINEVPSTFSEIRRANPNIQIFLYEMGPEVANDHDANPVVYLNDIGRYGVSRGHSQGSLNGQHPQWFLRDGAGRRLYNLAYSDPANNQYWYLLDFGLADYASYWTEAVRADIVTQPWRVDGVFADNALTRNGGSYGDSQKYPTDSAWSLAMNSFVQRTATGLQPDGQKLWVNRGSTALPEGFNTWLSLDQSGAAPYAVMEEGAFAVSWGDGETQFYPEEQWRRQIDIMGQVRNSNMTMSSHTDLARDRQGTDNWGKPVSFWQTLWYALGSFQLGRNDALGNSYFMFSGESVATKIWWYDEYDKIDLGRSVGAYRVTVVGGRNIYWREFERGYVYVNSADLPCVALDDEGFCIYGDVAPAQLTLPQACTEITHENLGAPPATLPRITSIRVAPHHAVFLRKAAATGQDSDGDGVADTADNCPAVPNSSQRNTDGDASGDACDSTPLGVCGGRAVTLRGTSSADTLNGGSAADVILGLGGNDTLNGNGGNDTLCGGTGNDVINGGSGADKLYGDGGRDRCNGGTQSDSATGCEQRSQIP